MSIPPILKRNAPLSLLILFALLATLIIATRPSAERSATVSVPAINVGVTKIVPSPFQVEINSYGRVKPLTQTQLAARVSGNVSYIDDTLRAGSTFKKGQLLLSLDQSDYQIELDIALAQVAEAESRLVSEQAQAEEARHDWRRSGRKGEPPALAVREPQLKAAEAALTSAKAGVARAKLNLDRTRIFAPYDGSTIRLNVALGQYVTPAAMLAEIFATDAAEITLPIKHKELHFLGLLDEQGPSSFDTLSAQIYSSLFKSSSWTGKVVRVASALDENSRQLNLIVRVDRPFSQDQQKPPLKVDEYVTAKIQGTTLEQAIAIPSNSLYEGRYVVVFEQGVLKRRDVSILFISNDHTLISDGLQTGELLVTTPLGQITSGTPAKILSDNQDEGL